MTNEKMKNMKLTENNWKRLKQIRGESMDSKLNYLMDMVEDIMPIVKYGEKTKNVKTYPSTMERLDGFKISLGESKDNIISRMFLAIDEQNGFEIPIKLTSVLNKNLFIYCLVTKYNIIKADDLDSEEYKAWIKLLDWKEIKSLSWAYADREISFVKQHYRIDINVKQ